jgi:hypothetical protein
MFPGIEEPCGKLQEMRSLLHFHPNRQKLSENLSRESIGQ